jgi:peptidyl-tRNA hydrolase
MRESERRRWGMPLFMDVHQKLPEGAGMKDVEAAHAADLKTQDKYGVKYLKYWVDEGQGKVFCLVDAPDAATAAKVHEEAHGLVAEEIYEVAEGS